MLTPAGCAPATLSRVITSSSNTNTITAVLLAFLLILASTNATPLGHGQNGLFLAPRAQSASTGTEADTSSRKKSGPPVAAIAVPIVVVLTLVLVLIFWSLHRKTKVQLPNRRASTQSAANNTSTAPTTPAATPAAQDGSQTRPGFFGGFWQWYHGPRGGFSRTGTQSTTDLRTSSTNASPQANSGATDAAAGSTPAQTNSGTTRRVGVHGPPPRSSRRNRNRTDGRPRRTDSGASVRTVPAYKSEVGDDEMVLFK